MYAMTHSGELWPIMFTDFLSCTPTACIAFAKASTSLRYCDHVQVRTFLFLSIRKAGFSPCFVAVYLKSSVRVMGLSEPKPDVLTLIGNSVSISVVQYRFLPS